MLIFINSSFADVFQHYSFISWNKSGWYKWILTGGITIQSQIKTGNLFPDGNRSRSRSRSRIILFCYSSHSFDWLFSLFEPKWKWVFFPWPLLISDGKLNRAAISTLNGTGRRTVIKRNLIMKISIFIRVDIDELLQNVIPAIKS